MTQQQLADEVGVHQTRVSHWERGSRIPNAEQIHALARVFDIEMQTLVAEFFVENNVERALLQDPLLPEDDKRALITIYRSVTRQVLAGG